jgi:hypothetical protein
MSSLEKLALYVESTLILLVFLLFRITVEAAESR